MKNLFLLIRLPILMGLIMCSCNDKECDTLGFSMKRIIFIEYNSDDGVNILQNDSHIEIFYDKNGIPEKVERSNLDYPNGFKITSLRDAAPDSSDELCVKVFPSNYLHDQNFSTTYIKFGDNQLDTIECEFYMTPNSIHIIKTWLNGTLVWDRQIGSAFPIIQIIK